MNIRVRCRTASLLWCAGLWGQSVSLSTISSQDGSSGSILLKLDSPSGKAPVALQWNFSLPPCVTVEPSDLNAGSAAESADKTLTCAASNPKPPGGGTIYRCILYGGEKPISNGTVATVLYRVAKNSARSSDKISARNVLGVSADTKPIPMADVEITLLSK